MLRTFLARLSLVILGCTSLLACVPVLPVEAQETRSAIIIGDSQAEGLNRPLTGALRAYHINVIGFSVHAGKSVSWLTANAGLAPLVSSRNPQLIIVIAGGNDQVSSSSEGRSEYEHTLSRFLTEAGGSAAYSHIVWVGPAHSLDASVQSKHDRSAAVQQPYLTGLGVRWIDGRPGSNDGPFQAITSSLTEAQIRSHNSHLTGAGYRRWACLLAPDIAGQPAAATCDTTAEADRVFPDTAGDSEGGAPATTGGGFTTYCDPNAAPVPITLGVAIGSIRQVSGLPEYVNTAYRYLVSVILVISIIMVVWGGFLYLTGAAGISSIQRGKQIIKDALIGMVIVLAAYAILNTINPSTTQFSLSPKNVACEAIDASTHDANADEGGTIPSCVKDSQCHEGRVCLRLNTTETIVGAGECTQGNANELCRGNDLDVSDDGSPTNGNGAGQVDCQTGTCQHVPNGGYRCITGDSGSVCNMYSDPTVPCASGLVCEQLRFGHNGRCVHGDYTDATLSPPPICSSFDEPTAHDYYEHTNALEAFTGGCRAPDGHVDSFCIAHFYQCSRVGTNANVCGEETYYSLFQHTIDSFYSHLDTIGPDLQPSSYFRPGCRKPIGASCTNDEECPSMCDPVSHTCMGFCVIRTDSIYRSAAGGSNPPRSHLEGACTASCGSDTWSAAAYGIGFSGDYLGVTIDGLDVVHPMSVSKAACYPLRATGNKCDFDGQCPTGGHCHFDPGVAHTAAFPSFSAPWDLNAGIGTCGS